MVVLLFCCRCRRFWRECSAGCGFLQVGIFEAFHGSGLNRAALTGRVR